MPPNIEAITQGLTEREQIQQVYIRVCRDSGFKLDYLQAASLTAKVLGNHPLGVWAQFPSLGVMIDIASGTHPAAHLQSEQSK